jgi:acetyltransferase-like isoleucine patch superfamily enzyme
MINIIIDLLHIRKYINALSCWRNLLLFKFLGFQTGNHFRGLGKICLKISKNHGSLKIGHHFILQAGGFRNAISRNAMACIQVDENANLIIGNHVRMSDVVIWARMSIEIGDFVTIGADTIIMDSNAHPLDWSDRRRECVDEQETKKKIKHQPVIIENDVFIGARCIIGKGVEIGKRSIIAAGSVVVSDIPADVTAGGNPCKVIRSNHI